MVGSRLYSGYGFWGYRLWVIEGVMVGSRLYSGIAFTHKMALFTKKIWIYEILLLLLRKNTRKTE